MSVLKLLKAFISGFKGGTKADEKIGISDNAVDYWFKKLNPNDSRSRGQAIYQYGDTQISGHGHVPRTGIDYKPDINNWSGYPNLTQKQDVCERQESRAEQLNSGDGGQSSVWMNRHQSDPGFNEIVSRLKLSNQNGEEIQNQQADASGNVHKSLQQILDNSRSSLTEKLRESGSVSSFDSFSRNLWNSNNQDAGGLSDSSPAPDAPGSMPGNQFGQNQLHGNHSPDPQNHLNQFGGFMNNGNNGGNSSQGGQFGGPGG